MNKVETLAKIIYQIHSFAYSPFYDVEEGDIWSELEETAENDVDVDKQFFIKIAEFIFSSIIDTKGNFDDEELAIILSRIHAHSLFPFYNEKEPQYLNDYIGWDGYYWDKLKETTKKNEEVDKMFFRKMAKSVVYHLSLTRE